LNLFVVLNTLILTAFVVIYPEDIITGLPVSDHDHGLNAIEFGDEGEIYFSIGSNTNGGVPGQLTNFQLYVRMIWQCCETTLSIFA
jgi:glucose/arabinose dehydrogenase